MADSPFDIGDLYDMIPPGETVRFGGFEITRWPEPAPRRKKGLPIIGPHLDGDGEPCPCTPGDADA